MQACKAGGKLAGSWVAAQPLCTCSNWKGTATTGTPWYAASLMLCTPQWLTKALVLGCPSTSCRSVSTASPEHVFCAAVYLSALPGKRTCSRAGEPGCARHITSRSLTQQSSGPLLLAQAPGTLPRCAGGLTL